jgi:hypothetical protein
MVPALPLALAAIGAVAALALSKKKGAPASGTFTTDAHIPPAVEQQVLGAIANEKDPSQLLMEATQLNAQGYPLAANALRMRAAELTPGAPLPDPQGLDGNMDPTTRAAVLHALATESDANKLMTFAGTIQLQYPIAAGLLVAKAQALGGGVPQGVAPPGTPAVSVDIPPAAPAAGPLALGPSPGLYVSPMAPDAPPTAAPTTLDNVLPPRPAPVPMPPPNATPLGAPAPPPDGMTWILATNADVQRDGTAGRYASLLSSPVGFEVHATYNGRLWKFRVISKTTDPGLTTYAKDVKGWVARSSAVVSPTAPPAMPSAVVPASPISPAPAPVTQSLTGVQQAALAMANAIGTRGYKLSDQGLYKAFQSASGGGADGFPGTGTMGKLAMVLASAGLPPLRVKVYPWHSMPGQTGYNGVNAPTWAEWTGTSSASLLS